MKKIGLIKMSGFKWFATLLRKLLGVPHHAALEGLAISCGYASFREVSLLAGEIKLLDDSVVGASTHRLMNLWHERLINAFELDDRTQIGRELVEVWFSRIFVLREQALLADADNDASSRENVPTLRLTSASTEVATSSAKGIPSIRGTVVNPNVVVQIKRRRLFEIPLEPQAN